MIVISIRLKKWNISLSLTLSLSLSLSLVLSPLVIIFHHATFYDSKAYDVYLYKLIATLQISQLNFKRCIRCAWKEA